MLPIAIVEWVDASMNSVHWAEGSLPSLPSDTSNVMYSVGYVAHNTREWVVLTQTLGEDIHANSVEIPTSMIRSYIQLPENTNGTF
jgi:hypothetical protein